MLKTTLIAARSPQETFWRTLQTFTVTRMAIALALLVYLSYNTRKGYWVSESFPYQELCTVYLVLSIGIFLLAWYYTRRFLLQLIVQIALDLAVISVLYVAAGGAKSGLAILYLFPLAGGSILAPLLLAFFFVSIATLVLLLESGYQLLDQSSDPTISQSGLYGAAFFAAVFFINRLAARLIKQERLAAQAGQDLSIQQAINRLVIADMDDGILVVGRDGTLYTVNPAADRMLGLPAPDGARRYKIDELPSLAPIAEAFSAWAARTAQRTPAEVGPPVFVMVKPGDDPGLHHIYANGWSGRREVAVHLKLRFATVDTAGLPKDRTIIFMQDVGDIENRAQQLKLASMGRLTASIAHEVRNPLSAISYAASLLGEDAAGPAQTRLVNIVSDNVGRLNRMIEDVLKLSRKVQASGEPMLLELLLGEIVEDFESTHALQKGMIAIARFDGQKVLFDPMHLREVVVNLLSNAVRYASGRAGCIRLYPVPDLGNRLELHVWNDGPPITPEVRAHLFEPFYTTSSKGTGLGLYVGRELCLNNNAVLDYEYLADPPEPGMQAGGRFVITFATSESL